MELHAGERPDTGLLPERADMGLFSVHLQINVSSVLSRGFSRSEFHTPISHSERNNAKIQTYLQSVVDEVGQNKMKRIAERIGEVGALWHIWKRDDRQNVCEYLRNKQQQSN